MDLRPSVPENPQSAHGKTGRIQQGISERGYAPARTCVEVSLQVEQDKRTVASGATRRNKGDTANKKLGWTFQAVQVFREFPPHAAVGVYLTGELESSTAGKGNNLINRH